MGHALSPKALERPPAPQTWSAERAEGSAPTPVDAQQLATVPCANAPLDLPELPGAHGVAARPTPSSLQPGQRIGDRYVLQTRLGVGSTAVVWRALDTHLARAVALKIFPSDAGAQSGQRHAAFAEARSISDVISEHVIRIQNLCPPQTDGPCYIDMELCCEYSPEEKQWRIGRPLTVTPPSSTEEAVRWIAQAARGVQAAHDRGVFHRDLKPSNILVRPISRRAQVTDFGLALPRPLLDGALEVPGRQLGPPSQQPRIAGTPRYMAPEQAVGLSPRLDLENPQDLDLLRRIDVYGLGACLYTLLAGRPPYRPRSGVEDPVEDVLSQVRSRPPSPLRSGDSLLRVNRRLARIVNKAISFDPSKRQDSAGQLADDLERYLRHQPGSADRRHPLLRMGLAVRRRWSLVLCVAALSLLGLQLSFSEEPAAVLVDSPVSLWQKFAHGPGLLEGFPQISSHSEAPEPTS